MAKDLDEIKKLRPEERITRLRELEEKKKKEIEEAEKLIDDSIEQIREERILEEVNVPTSGAVDISRHFIQEESALETVAREEVKEKLEGAVTQYTTRLEELRESIYENPANKEELMQEARYQMTKLSEIGSHYSLSREAARAFNTAQNIYEDIKRYRV